MDVGVSEVLEENKLHQDDLVAVIGFFGNISPLFVRNVSHHIIDLKWVVDDEPVKERTCKVNDHALSLDKGE